MNTSMSPAQVLVACLQEAGEDVEAGFRFLDSFRPTHYLIGNHEVRLWDAARGAKDGRVRALAADLIARINAAADKLRCPVLPYDKRLGVLKIGHLKFLHGFGGGGVNSARDHARSYGSCLIGHIHAVDEASVAGLDRRVCRSVGALCNLDMHYNARMVGSLRHAQGFGYGVIDEKTGEYSVHQAERIGDRFFIWTFDALDAYCRKGADISHVFAAVRGWGVVSHRMN